MTCTLTAERRAQNDAALAAYRAACLSPDIAAIWTAFAAVEGRLASAGRMGQGAEYERIRCAMNEITRMRRQSRAARQNACASRGG